MWPWANQWLPKERYLSGFLLWLAAGVLSKIGHDMLVDTSKVTAAAGSFLMGFVYTYLFGAVWSDFAFVSYVSVALSVFIAVTILGRHRQWRAAAQWALLILMLLCMFVLWLEPFLTWTGIITNVAGILLKLPMFFVDIGFTLFWIFMFAFVSDQIDAELKLEPAPPVHSA